MNAIITQLVFEHALRIRVKAETSSAGTTPAATPQGRSESTTPDSASIRDAPFISESSGTVDEESEPSTASSSIKGTPTEETPTTTSSGGDREEPGQSKNLVGKMNNLVTSDLENIVDGRDFVLLSSSPSVLFCAHGPSNEFRLVVYLPLQIALCIWFLYEILGWSAFVGMAAMIALFPIPGVIASKIQKVQKESMKQASIALSTFLCWR
jgi:hypothetical protein